MSKFWETKRISELTAEEWEQLCDGCAKCCFHKLEDEDSGQIYYTSVVCRLLNRETRRCTDYMDRHELVPDCACMSSETIDALYWLPSTCAYRRLASGRNLPDWHPLLTGDPTSTYEIYPLNEVVGEDEAGEMEDHIISEQP